MRDEQEGERNEGKGVMNERGEVRDEGRGCEGVRVSEHRRVRRVEGAIVGMREER